MNAREVKSPVRINDSRRMPDREIERKSDRLDATPHARDDGMGPPPRDQAEREIDFDIAAWFGLQDEHDRVHCMTECWYG